MKKAFGVVGIALAMTIAPAGAVTLFDDFSLPAGGVTVQIGPSSNPQTIVTALPNGTRTATFTVTSTVLFNSLNGGIGGGMLAAGWNPVSTGTVSVDYAFSSALDISTEAMIEVVAAASAGVGLQIDLYTSGGTLTRTSSLTPGGFSPNSYLISSFSGAGDLANVTGARLLFTGANSSNFLVDNFAATPTPEPGTALLLALPVLALVRRKRK